jgi:hypothetical protein
MIAVFIDGSAWNVLFKQDIDLNLELPSSEFALYITREVEIELLAIPDIGKDGTRKVELKRYITEAVGRGGVKTIGHFGFAEAGPTSMPFDQGTFPSDDEQRRHEEFKGHFLHRSIRPTGLGKNQADASLATRAFDSIILTNDNDGGPIAEAARLGGKVVSLAGFDRKAVSLRDYILRSGVCSATN